jgi:hypothetical protein
MKLAVEENNLICLVKGHVVCYCSCEKEYTCCGCDQPREERPIDLHCLACGEDLHRYVVAENDFDACPIRIDKDVAYNYSMEIAKMISEANGDKLPKADERRSPGPDAGSLDQVQRATDPEPA